MLFHVDGWLMSGGLLSFVHSAGPVGVSSKIEKNYFVFQIKISEPHKTPNPGSFFKQNKNKRGRWVAALGACQDFFYYFSVASCALLAGFVSCTLQCSVSAAGEHKASMVG